MLKVSTPRINAQAPSKTIPQTKGLPIIGSLPQLLQSKVKFLEQAQQIHGDIYTLDLGLAKVVVFNHPRHAQHILRDNAANYRKGGAMWDYVRTLLGNGLVVSEGDFWLRQRRMMQPQFHRKRLAGLTELMISAIDEALSQWEPGTSADEPFDVSRPFNQLTMRVIVKTLFGTSLSEEELDEAAEAITYFLDYMMQGMVLTRLPDWLPVPGKRAYLDALAKFDEIVYRIIKRYRESENEDNHLLAMLLDVVDAETGEGMTDQQVRDEVATLLSAGYETTALTLCWAVHHLTRTPEILQKLLTEIDSVLDGRQPTFADLPELPYSKMVLQEVMRISPPSYWLPRVAVEDDVVDGYTIPAGTHVVSMTYMYHHHPDVWDNPDQFDPERFSPEQATNRNRFAWIPFGAGQRMCIGRDFSIMEGQLALIMMLQRFNIKSVAGHEPGIQLTSTLRPKGGVLVHLTPRD